jgi:hypothetical protein
VQAKERQHHILVTVGDAGGVDVAEVAAALSIRRDLWVLERYGPVRRGHLPHRRSGVTPAGGPAPRRCRDGVHRRGLTARLIAEALPVDRPLTVVTGSPPTAAVLGADEATTVLLLGGRVRGGGCQLVAKRMGINVHDGRYYRLGWCAGWPIGSRTGAQQMPAPGGSRAPFRPDRWRVGGSVRCLVDRWVRVGVRVCGVGRWG